MDSPKFSIRNFINGEFVSCDQLIDSYDPSVGEVWAQIPDSGEEEINAAVAAAKAAFPGWLSTPLEERCDVMLRIANIVESNLDELAELESRDQGKPVWLAKAVDIPRVIHNFRFFANAFKYQMNISNQMDVAGALNYTIRSPIGVAGLISPWNLPLYLLSFKLAPAIAAGNTVVAKPSEMTSVSAWRLCQMFNEAGLPPGVINVVFGTGPRAGNALVCHPEVPLISFTGGTVTATRIRASTAHLCKKYSFELGGKNAAIIFNDTDLEKCVSTTIRSSFINQGEICLCTSRIFVQREIFQAFLKKFVAAAKEITVGDPRKTDSWMGALISKEHLAKVKGYVAIAREEGASIMCGDMVDSLNIPDCNKNGFFMLPVVVCPQSDNSRLMQEEIFGPVTCVVPFDTTEEVIERANNVHYGLCATVWTKDNATLHQVAHKLQVATVWANCWLVRDLNMPFGGVKDSGLGRESAHDSLDFFTEQKTICIKL